MPRSILPTRRAAGLEPLAAKVPEIGVLFWTAKLLTTGIGEATSDFLGQTNLALAGFVGLFGFVIALRMQLRERIYRAPVYWFAVLMVAVFGTMAADVLRVGAGISYGITTAFYAVVLAFVLGWWYRSEGTLSIHSITTRRRERFYWLTVLSTFALGTALGDLTALQLHLGFFGSAVFFSAVIAVPGLLWWRGWMNPVAAFWAAYVITRPLGASFADWFAKPQAITGLDLGDGFVTAVGLLAFVALVTYIAVAKRDIQPHVHEHAHGLRRLGIRTQPVES